MRNESTALESGNGRQLAVRKCLSFLKACFGLADEIKTTCNTNQVFSVDGTSGKPQ
ncbi:MAG: hypothetical protein ACYSW3_30400 [Planctomycetota bacterium]